MLELVRKGNEVYYEGKKLTIVAQATKGPNKEVVKIADINSLGKKWISLNLLKEGSNIIEDKDLVGRQVSTKDYQLTQDEQNQINELKAQIDAIIENAKKRYIPKSKKLEDMSIEELEAYIAQRKMA